MFSSTAEYALRIMVILTKLQGEWITGEQISQHTKVPTDYAVKILHTLGRARMVEGLRGRGGGFRIACDPARTTLLDVVNVVDPVEHITSCPLGYTEHTTLCPMHTQIEEVIKYTERSFSRTTLRDVVDSAHGHVLCTDQSAPVGLTVHGSATTGRSNGRPQNDTLATPRTRRSAPRPSAGPRRRSGSKTR